MEIPYNMHVKYYDMCDPFKSHQYTRFERITRNGIHIMPNPQRSAYCNNKILWDDFASIIVFGIKRKQEYRDVLNNGHVCVKCLKGMFDELLREA